MLEIVLYVLTKVSDEVICLNSICYNAEMYMCCEKQTFICIVSKWLQVTDWGGTPLNSDLDILCYYFVWVEQKGDIIMYVSLALDSVIKFTSESSACERTYSWQNWVISCHVFLKERS